jgi:hypothetical protein
MWWAASAVRDEDARARGSAAGEFGRPALDDGLKAEEREDPGWRGTVRAEAAGVADHRAHREAAEDGVRGADAGALPNSSCRPASFASAVRNVSQSE